MGVGKKFVGHCHSVMHEYETLQIFKFPGGELRVEVGKFQVPHLYETLISECFSQRGKGSLALSGC